MPLLGEPLEGASIAPVGFLQGRLEFRLALGVACRRDNERLAIGRNLERRFWINLQQIQDWLVNDQRVTVSVLDKLLNHSDLPILQFATSWRSISEIGAHAA